METDMGTVLRRVREGARRQCAKRRARGRDANSAGRATHAARVADQVHMDPPPQAHIGVGHGPEYTMAVRAGQLALGMRTER
ncbi:hypothetical protein GCM10010129_60880 [Streptomyces fumigatiscleroticus]|nr:hypothetical protein GCM10010129_60880 [Streptomyces fumigatiscleroticus]